LNITLSKPDKLQNSLIRSGYFVGAVLLHVVVFFMVATWIVFKAPAVHDDSTFLSTSVTPPPPPPPAPPAASGGDAVNNFEPAAQATPAPAMPSIVVTSNASAFSVNAVAVAIPNLPAATAPPSGSGLSGHDTPGQQAGAGSPFGSAATGGATQLEGYLYDLKQTPDGKPTNMDPGLYHQKIRDFVANDWDPSLLHSYYQCATPLHASSIFIPVINADDGPKAFGVEKEVKPNMYCVLYKVTAAPSQDGTYHFIGTGDDILLVRVNHRTMLDACDRPATDELRQKEATVTMTNFNPTWPDNGIFKIGPAFHVSANEAVDIEVLIGEEPGGRSDYFLFIEREESTYDKQSNGTPLWPIFQLDPKPIHPVSEAQSFPPFSATPEPWEAVTNP
jgi:hypothetical protein